jgi:magnesium chelatase subunit I
MVSRKICCIALCLGWYDQLHSCGIIIIMQIRYTYPFAALIGQEKMKSGLLLNAVDPSIGGILISGHKGTGKSTAVRALAEILPKIEVVKGCPYHCPVDNISMMCSSCAEIFQKGEELPTEMRSMPLVELPLSATEDRVVGTLHIEQTLKTGERNFEPGLLAAANRGILYVDEVNLLDDHLVDILLDAAASGINVIEREGISHVHPARFMLVGTMNPEEGELRPQFLDRFGLSLSVNSVSDQRLRAQIVSRRIAFDSDPESFVSKYSAEETVLANQVLTARELVNSVTIPQEMIELAVQLSVEVEAQGHRAEIAIIKTARSLAAFLENSEVNQDHIAEAARFVLLHRITNIPLATAGLLEEKLEEILTGILDKEKLEKSDTSFEEAYEPWDEISEQVPGANAASNVDMLFSFLEEKKKLFSMQMS